ncbi:3-hydroxyacyl-CoA dehydrogenase family protein [Paeniglutamicibacter sulfureus]|uniref:3-hydroxybutyryl-CoA dehydrogenase n=1 Tax=Paeniglutamicibacter sulfureus TaxID=43666 RepID=A0ABU2BF75_9MICC|nr:3-hydroxyacyl-CoA dehydrogenase family protein [Paeniglutamicibacter sulfureus]MDR7357292.1 3-hydroxybutyryl-CoA dehydrogenase [Paeniglutamicibacter sulfureus]
MTSTPKKPRLVVVGSGAMGTGIAQVSYDAGFHVTLVDPSPRALDAAQSRIINASARAIANEPGSRQSGELHTSGSYDGLELADLVIEAVPEIPEVKLAVLKEISSLASASVVIASNTSTIPITQLGQVVDVAERFIGMHFFNPVPKMKLVEIIRGQHTSEPTTSLATRFVEQWLGKTALVVSDRPGFVVNRLLIPYLISAARMLDAGYCSAETIDNGMQLGCSMPIGPIRLADYIGLDVLCQAADSIHAETQDPSCIVPDNIRALVQAGKLGRKSGQGFFSYTPIYS